MGFKCEGYWSDWLTIELIDNCSMRKTFGEHSVRAKQLNVQCKNGPCENPLTIGVKLSSRALDDGKGVNLIIYADIWLRNLTSLPLTFGAPSHQVGLEESQKTKLDPSSLPGKVSADSALIELTSVLEGNSFGLFGSSDDDDLCVVILNLPLQQCKENFEEVFEY